MNERSGRAEDFRCLYHAWTYDLDGELGCSWPCQFREDRGKRDLKPVALDVWNGLIFVHLGAEPPTLKSFLGPVTDLLSGYQFAQMTLVQDRQ